MLKKSVVIGAHKFRKNRPSFTDYKSIIFLCLFICGVVFGVMLSQKGSEAWHSFFNTLINNHLTAKRESGLLMNFCGAFAPLLALLIYNYIFGMCGAGMPFLYLTPIALGVYAGVCAAQFYLGFGLQGILYWCCVNIPCNAIAAATLIRCCCYGSELSGYVFSVLIYPKTERKDNLLREYTLKYLIMTLPLILGAILSAITFKLMGELFLFVG